MCNGTKVITQSVTCKSLKRRGTQVVRERSAKPLCVGSIPTRASNLFRVLRSYSTIRESLLKRNLQLPFALTTQQSPVSAGLPSLLPISASLGSISDGDLSSVVRRASPQHSCSLSALPEKGLCNCFVLCSGSQTPSSKSCFNESVFPSRGLVHWCRG